MHCFASENQTYTGTWLFGIESWKSLKDQENLLLKNLQVKTHVENVRFLSWKIFLSESTVFKAPTKWFLKGLYLYASFRFPSIRFDAPTLLPFSGCTQCPPVVKTSLTGQLGDALVACCLFTSFWVWHYLFLRYGIGRSPEALKKNATVALLD